MKVSICKSFNFSASHQLVLLPPEHKCRRLHGHSYRVDVFLTDALDQNGMVRDFADVTEAWKALHLTLDHRHLNDIPALMRPQPTTEVLAQFILAALASSLGQQVARVRVHEGDSSWAEAHW